MKKLKLFITSLVALFSLSPAFAPVAVLAQANQINCGIEGDFSKECENNAPTEDTTVTDTVQNAIRLFQVVVGLIAVFMIIFGGLKYITSGGNDGGIKSAKNTLLYAVVGLVIVLIAEGVVRFVLTRFS